MEAANHAVGAAAPRPDPARAVIARRGHAAGAEVAPRGGVTFAEFVMSAEVNPAAEILVEFDEAVAAADGTAWRARVAGAPNPLGHWEGWIEFVPASRRAGATTATDWVPTERETTQPNLADLKYWATGLTIVYLQGALARAIDRTRPRATPPLADSAPSRGPASHVPPAAPIPAGVMTHAVLDPFAVYEQGEGVLRSELHALSADHLRAIVAAYGLAVVATPTATLADRILDAVRANAATR